MQNMSKNTILLIVGGVVLLCALGAITLFLILGAQNYFGGGQPTQLGPDAAYTSVAQTVEAAADPGCDRYAVGRAFADACSGAADEHADPTAPTANQYPAAAYEYTDPANGYTHSGSLRPGNFCRGCFLPG